MNNNENNLTNLFDIIKPNKVLKVITSMSYELRHEFAMFWLDYVYRRTELEHKDSESYIKEVNIMSNIRDNKLVLVNLQDQSTFTTYEINLYPDTGLPGYYEYSTSEYFTFVSDLIEDRTWTRHLGDKRGGAMSTYLTTLLQNRESICTIKSLIQADPSARMTSLQERAMTLLQNVPCICEVCDLSGKRYSDKDRALIRKIEQLGTDPNHLLHWKIIDTRSREIPHVHKIMTEYPKVMEYLLRKEYIMMCSETGEISR
jgi:hypothetical protein